MAQRRVSLDKFLSNHCIPLMHSYCQYQNAAGMAGDVHCASGQPAILRQTVHRCLSTRQVAHGPEATPSYEQIRTKL